MKVQLKLAIAIAFLGVIALCVVAYRDAAREWKAIQGEWEMVSVQGNGASGDWRFSTNGYVDGPGGRSHYSMNPLLRSITWADGKAHGTYELDGNNLKIFLQDGDKPEIRWTFKKVRSY